MRRSPTSSGHQAMPMPGQYTGKGYVDVRARGVAHALARVANYRRLVTFRRAKSQVAKIALALASSAQQRTRPDPPELGACTELK